MRAIGGILVFVSFGLIAFFLVHDIVTGGANPYLGIVTYLVLPVLLVTGLALVPFDGWVQRRRKARGQEVPEPIRLNLGDPAQRKVASFFGISGVIVLVALTTISYRSVEFMDTKTFCGKVCHKVMLPELIAYERSSHASVACIQCHIGPGASWFVRSKLSGVPQVWHYARKDYPRPLPTPVPALRPSRDTCENCHAPKQFYGDQLRTIINYDQDEKNTRTVQTMMMKVGSGGVAGSGIHGHMISKIYYLPGTKDHREVAWLSVERPDGSKQEFINPEYKEKVFAVRKQFNIRRMDCIDCHNRPAHEFVSFEKLFDEAITRREIDAGIPYFKREIMKAVGEQEGVPTEADQKRVATLIEQVKTDYEKRMPGIYGKMSQSIDSSVNKARELYLTSAFPHMKIDSTTYTNWRSHDGCFRCHGSMEAWTKGKSEVPSDCTYCHSEPVEASPGG